MYKKADGKRARCCKIKTIGLYSGHSEKTRERL